MTTTTVVRRERKPRPSKAGITLSHGEGQDLLNALSFSRRAWPRSGPLASPDLLKAFEKLELKLWTHARKTRR